ncbi:MAG: hypothetical protein IJT27_09560 [Clostridia bacterium]|nr:hypothetical protein [Clostridia bacterium]
MRDLLFDVLESMGVYFSEAERAADRDLNLLEYISNSHILVAFALKIEEKLHVDLPEDALLPENLQSLNKLAALLSALPPEEE